MASFWQELRKDLPAMQYDTITVEYIHTTPERKSAGIKDTRNIWWSVWKEQAGRFQKGGTYEIGFTVSEGSNGRQYNNIQEVDGKALPRGRTAQTHAPAAQQQVKPSPKPVPKEPDQKDQLIFFQAMAKSMLERDPAVALPDVADQVMTCWNRQIKPWLDRKDLDKDLADEIPFDLGG